ncbi:MAG: hypothetical protein ACJ77A_15520 [Actinomycetota bacterium]
MPQNPLAAVAPSDPPEPTLLQNTRRGRALIGWMTEASALRMMCSGRADVTPTDEQRTRAAEARAAVASRVPVAEHDEDPTAPAPPDVLAAFGPNRVQEAAPDGFEIRLVDLRRVRAFQTHVLTEHAVERVANVEPEDLAQLTALTLPSHQPAAVPIQYDESQKSWTVLWPNLNMRVLENFQQGATDQSGNPLIILGFVLGTRPSLLRVTEHQGRYVLTDGYHRAFGLLSRGIDRVPALFHSAANFEDINVPPGMLPQLQWLGTRPPRLVDYLDEAVAEPVDVVAAQRLITVSALETGVMG